MFEIHPKNPFRPPSWRWQRSGQLVDGEQYSRLRDDPWIRKARDFRIALGAVNDAGRVNSEERLIIRFPGLYLANTLYNGQLSGHTNMRYELEARIMADETADELAQRFGIIREAIEAYERVFFDVRSRLCHPSYVLHSVIGTQGSRGCTERDLEVLWKLFGYYTGPYVLDHVITGFANRESLLGMGSDEAMDSVISTRLRQKTTVASLTLPINIMTQQMILEGWQQIRKHDKEVQSLGAQQDALLSNIGTLMALKPFAVGKQPSKLTLDSSARAAKYESGSFELRGDELMAVAIGQELPYGDVLTEESTRGNS